MRKLAIQYMPVSRLKPSPRNARTHSKRQLRQLENSIRANAYVTPLIVDEDDMVIAGHGRLLAAKSMQLESLPVIVLDGLSDIQKRSLMLADNKIAANAGWDRETLAKELGELIVIEDLDISLTGFETPEIDQILFDYSADVADQCPETPAIPISQPGDLWNLGPHRLLCGDARSPADIATLCGPDLAAMAFLDPPYNVRVAGIVGRGSVKHEEFAMASGEMAPEQFRAFLELTLGNAAGVSKDGAVHFVCMDWRHIEDLMAAGRSTYGKALNVIAWVKSNGGQGSFYRSQHELIGVFRVGQAANVNNVELGRHGRNRSNVWEYAGVNSFGKGRLDDLKSHPTVKPVAMIVDAIRDCTKQHDIVLDTFAGSGTTLIASERIGRHARCLEYLPAFVDVAIRRWQAFTGKDAVHSETGEVFDEMVDRPRSPSELRSASPDIFAPDS